MADEMTPVLTRIAVRVVLKETRSPLIVGETRGDMVFAPGGDVGVYDGPPLVATRDAAVRLEVWRGNELVVYGHGEVLVQQGETVSCIPRWGA